MTDEELLNELERLLALVLSPPPKCNCPNFGHYEPECAMRKARVHRDEARLSLRTLIFEHAEALLPLARLGLRRERELTDVRARATLVISEIRLKAAELRAWNNNNGDSQASRLNWAADKISAAVSEERREGG